MPVTLAEGSGEFHLLAGQPPIDRQIVAPLQPGKPENRSETEMTTFVMVGLCPISLSRPSPFVYRAPRERTWKRGK